MSLKLRALALLIISIAIAGCGGSDGESDLPDLTQFTDTQTERVHAIRDGVATLRGLPMPEGIEEGTLTRAQYQEYNSSGLERLAPEAREELEFYNDVWRLMRFIGPEDDLFALMDETSDVGIVGFYLFRDDSLVLIDDGLGTELTLSEESTVAHEYVHALQDGRFDLIELQEESATDESVQSELAETLPCVWEGDASLAENLYMAGAHGESWQETEEATETAGESPFADTPPIILAYFGFNYRECIDFVTAVYEERGWDGVNDLYANPPATTEQVLHPEKYFAGEAAVSMADTDFSSVLGDGWSRAETGAFGEFDVAAFFLGAGAFYPQALGIAEGWAGGVSSFYRLDGEAGAADEALVHISLKWDSLADFNQFGLALGGVIAGQGWEVEREAEGVLHWWLDEETGYALYDSQSLQFDLIYATNPTAAGIAREALKAGLGTPAQ